MTLLILNTLKELDMAVTSASLALVGYGRRECGMRFGPIFAYLLMIV